ncbi:CopG family transcriptional regulator [Sphingobium terrigena]|uniref:CopG family transcriptional regulator n=2 Tax=Sphingomonadaceae TaxID=41297 RepID=A0A418YM35_9SPHN|nr:CopG family transcriptional regulator [Sphingobium terrigena]RJG52205.1 CopG family transcriptional regulator [Sphingobium terrigena]|tara:strand:- start:1312 stop:1689 length:378 start_codon:yes stop_codon:yes gene_type:complete
MTEDDDDSFADNHAERAQARALREQARAGGLRFEAYLTGDQADWLLERIERGLFHDPSEAVFAIVQNFRELEPHRDLRDALLGRMLDAARADLEPGRPIDEVFDELRRDMAKPRPEPARWEKSAR